MTSGHHMPKIKEIVTVHIPVEIEYEARKGAREHVIRILERGSVTNCFGAGELGGYSTKVLPVERIVPFGQR